MLFSIASDAMFYGAPSRQDLRVVVRPRNQDAGPSEQF